MRNHRVSPSVRSCVLALAVMGPMAWVGVSTRAAFGDVVTGGALALRSSGAAEGGTGWTLSQDGYVGTYVTLSQAGPVSLNVNAFGTAAGGGDWRRT